MSSITLRRSSFRLAHALLSAVATGAAQENIVLAPTSVRDILAILRIGAAGQTAAEIDQLLGAEQRPHADDPEIVTRLHALIHDERVAVANDFAQRTKRQYQMAIEPVDMAHDPTASARKLNAWAAQASGGSIPALTDPDTLTAEHGFSLASALSFRARWQRPFAPEITRPQPFHDQNGQRADVPMMLESGQYDYARTQHEEVVRVPYQGGRYSMLLSLPCDPNAPPIPNRPDAYDEWRASWRPREVNLNLPRIELPPQRRSLRPALEQLGIKRVFTAEAELPAFASPARAALAAAYQTVVLSMIEEGTFVAAVTMLIGLLADDGSDPITIIFNRPFFFCIVDHGAKDDVLVAGQITQLPPPA